MHTGKRLIGGAVVFILGLMFTGLASATPAPQSGVCPAIGTLSPSITDCNVEIFANTGGGFTTIGPNLSNPYDGIEDNLVGIINNSGHTIFSLSFTGTGLIPLFAFDGDGLQVFGGAGGSPDTTGYGGQTSLGQNDYFININSILQSGTVVFGSGGIPNGGTAYFSLEGPPSLNITPHVPEPGILGMFGLGVLLIGLFAGLRRRMR